MSSERRAHKFRRCPIPGCDWKQTTAWFVGGPGVIERVSDKYLELEATSHMTQVHAKPIKTIVDVNGLRDAHEQL
jgi:hypothetical protein